MADSEFINTKEACKILGITRPTLYARIREGEIHPEPKPRGAKRAHRLKFRRTQIETYQYGGGQTAVGVLQGAAQ